MKYLGYTISRPFIVNGEYTVNVHVGKMCYFKKSSRVSAEDALKKAKRSIDSERERQKYIQ